MKKILSPLLIVSALAFAGSQLNAEITQLTPSVTAEIVQNTTPLTPSSLNLFAEGFRTLGSQIKNSSTNKWLKTVDVTKKGAQITKAALKTGWDKTNYGLKTTGEYIVKGFSKADEYGYNGIKTIVQHPVTTVAAVLVAWGIWKVTPKIYNWMCTKYKNRTMRKLEEAKLAAQTKLIELEQEIEALSEKARRTTKMEEIYKNAAQTLSNDHSVKLSNEYNNALLLAHATKGNNAIVKITKNVTKNPQDQDYLYVMAGSLNKEIAELNKKKAQLINEQEKLQETAK